MELIMSYLDMPLKDKTPRQQELERRLREKIFIDWAGNVVVQVENGRGN